MKLKLILIGIGVVFTALGVVFNPFVVVKKSDVKTWKTNAYNDSISVAKLSRENIIQDSLLWSLQQDIDILKANESKFQITIAGLSAENKRLRKAENTCCEELKHAEETGGIIRYNWLGKVKKKK